jgi:small subunit ribosomal protein S20
LANLRSAIKRNRQNKKRRLRNRVYRGQARSYIRDARASIQTEDLDAAREATLKAISALDKAAGKGVLHKNNAARRKSRLMKQLAALEKQNA